MNKLNVFMNKPRSLFHDILTGVGFALSCFGIVTVVVLAGHYIGKFVVWFVA